MRVFWNLLWLGSLAAVLTFGAAILGKQAQEAEARQAWGAGEDGEVGQERLYFATGEYDCKREWDAIIRLDDISLANSEGGALSEDLALPVRQLMTDTVGVPLNFVHNIFVDEARDEMYLASLFSGVDPDIDVCDTTNMDLHTGSVSVLSNVSQAPGEQQLVRHIYGDQTGLVQPHGIWLDHATEDLYVANTHEGNIVVFDNAYTADGNVAPERVITSPYMRAPTHLYIDAETDRMFVANFSGEDLSLNPNTWYPDDGTLPSVLIFENASQLEGSVMPSARILDNDNVAPPDPTRLRQGIAHITHNVWYAGEHNLLFVVHHTNEVLVFDLDQMGQPAAGCADPMRCALRPKAVIEVGTDTAVEYFSAYGLFYRPDADRLFVTVGRTDVDLDATTNYVIVPGVPPNVILVYDDVSTFESNGPYPFAPARRIYWETGQEDYYPPQPLWVTVDRAQYPTYIPYITQP